MLVIEIRKDDKLLFQYDPVNRLIWTKQKNGKVYCTNLNIVDGEHAAQIQTYLSTTSTDPLSATEYR
jgi:hypothetical protein